MTNTNPNYEYRYIDKRQKINLILCKLFLILFIFAFQALIIHGSNLTLSESLMFTSAIMQAIFAYINLMTVRVEVQELFEPPIKWKGYEFFWIGIVMFVASFLV